MNRFIISLLLLVIACRVAAAESSVWKAHKEGSVIYLGGTFHLLRDGDYPLPPEFAKAYQAADIVVFETDIGRMLDQATRQQLLTKARYADGSTLAKHLTPLTYKELSSYCAANNIPLEQFEQFKPAMLMLTLTLMELEKMGVRQQGVDQFFYDLALKEKKGIEGLETVEEQVQYVVSMADGFEDEFVSYSLKDMATLRQQFAALASAWRTGDAEKLDELLVADLKTRQPKLYSRLITERNRNWLAIIDAYQNMPRTRLVLVGAGHLVGSDGIIAALKKKGYRVEKL